MLSPQSGDTFIHKFNGGGTVWFTFIKDVNGHVPQIKLTYEYDGKDGFPVNYQAVIVNRISSLIPYTPSSEQLSEYVGQYKINGFPTREPANITLEGGVLFFADGPRKIDGTRDKLSLFPDSKDRFLLKHYHAILTFMRDQRGNITQIEIIESPQSKWFLHRL